MTLMGYEYMGLYCYKILKKNIKESMSTVE